MTRPVMIIDFESRSALKLGRGGTNAFEYAKHPTTDVWCYAYADGNRPLDKGTLHCTTVKQVNRHIPKGADTMPPRLRKHVESGGMICAHNASFEYAVWNFIMVPRYGWCPLPIEQMDDTAARVARIGLPRSLERCAPLLNCRNQKDLGGKNTMKAMAKPRKIMGVMEADIIKYIGNRDKYTCIVNDLKQEGLRTLHDWAVYEWWDEPERRELLLAYCKQDVVTQLEVHQKVPPLPDAEREVWLATMRANIRGTALDTDFVNRAVKVINKRMEEYAQELSAVTNGQVTSHTQLPAMKAWMQEKGYDADSLDKHAIAAMLDDKKMDADVKTALKIRQVAGKSSVAKFPSMKIHSGREGVAHDQIVYYGATATGRWSALGFQLQNLPARGPVTYKQAEWCIRLIKSARNLQDAVDTIESVLDGSIIETLSMCLRGAIKARDGYDLYCADYSNIEGRVAAWLGGEQWKLDAFTAFDEGRGPDLYKVTAGGILGISPEDVDKTQRNVLGKVSDLALQFQGGVGAYVSMGAVYGVDMNDYADIIHESMAGYWDAAEENYESFGKAQGRDLSKRAWVASESVKLAWRARHPGIVQAWYDIEAAAFRAIQAPGTAHEVCDGKIGVLAKSIQGKLFLLLRLPSGRCIHYANVKIGLTKTGWGTRKDTILFDKVEGGRVLRSATYGGDLFQSCLSRGTLILTTYGWLPIEQVSSDIKVWDGEAWVRHGGVVCNGSREVINLNGVVMTPDHKVLTTEGWKSASSSKGYHRTESRLPDRYQIFGQQWKEVPMASGVYLWRSKNIPGGGIAKRQKTGLRNVLRLQAVRDYFNTPYLAWNVSPSVVCGMGQHDSAVPPQTGGELRGVWRAGYKSLSTVASVFSGVLRRYGRHLRIGSIAGPRRRERELLRGELPVGRSGNSKQQQTQLGSAQRRFSETGIDGNGDIEKYAVLQVKERVPTGYADQPAERGKQFSTVYDLVNCGPRNRFVVRDGEGMPLIVHNCVQGTARDIMANGWLNTVRGGYHGLFSVHDEMASEIEHGKGNLDEYTALLCDTPEWAAGCPVTASGYVSDRFRKD